MSSLRTFKLPREAIEADQLFAMATSEEALEFVNFIVEETGRKYETYENIVYTPLGVGCSQELIVEDVLSFRKIQKEEKERGK